MVLCLSLPLQAGPADKAGSLAEMAHPEVDGPFPEVSESIFRPCKKQKLEIDVTQNGGQQQSLFAGRQTQCV